VTLQEIERLRIWPITLRAAQAVEVPAARLDPQGIAITVSATESVTSLIAFELDAGEGERLAFVLNLPVTGLPDERDRAILRTIIRNKAGFLRYLLLLLAAEGQMSQSVLDQLISGEQESPGSPHEHALMDHIPLFEELVRTFSREPARIRRIGRIIKELTADEGGEALLPAGFLTLWQTFEAAMEDTPRA
jgi:hypothetical protein